MTTIAYREGVLASDSRVTIKAFIDNDNVKKLFKLPDGSVVGMAGSWTPGMDLYRALKKAAKEAKDGEEMQLPFVNGKYQAILVSPLGDAWYNENGEWNNLKKWNYDYIAIGSGGAVAMAAMDAGADARTAVAVGIKRDVYSGGKIQSYKVF